MKVIFPTSKSLVKLGPTNDTKWTLRIKLYSEMIVAWEIDIDVCKFLFSYLFILTSVLTLHRGAQLVTSRGQLGLKVQHSVENSVSRILALTSHFRPSVHKRDILPFLHFMTLEVLGPFGARLLGSGLWACLTSSFTPLGRSCRVTHALMIQYGFSP